MASRCSMSLVSIGSTLTETFGTDPPLPALTSDDNALNILPISYPTGQQSNTLALIHDAFQPLSYWNGFMSKNTQYVGVAMDTHIYQMFTDQVHHVLWRIRSAHAHGHPTTAGCIAQCSRAYPV